MPLGAKKSKAKQTADPLVSLFPPPLPTSPNRRLLLIYLFCLQLVFGKQGGCNGRSGQICPIYFQVKTTSPRKYFVRPNASIVQPWDSCTITITLQAQKDYPPDMQCKDKFLIQSTKVAASTDMDEIPPDTFNKEADKVIEEMKLKVVYTLPSCGGSDDSSVSSLGSRSFKAASDDLMMLKNASLEEVLFHEGISLQQEVCALALIKTIQTIQRLKEERDNMLQQNQQMQRELDVLRRRRSRKGDAGFSLTFAAFAGLIGLMVGLLMSLIFSSAPADA
ncbi:Vesicle-associated protein 2-1 [Zea mays]|uniref:Vesicle-associated protein 2-1 n=1 Tax=Zea mays TaxID=4577 RepID=A0A1D6HEV1_MAIZE|nr:Vesicle-associated protein 2-1 [Zea mays]